MKLINLLIYIFCLTLCLGIGILFSILLFIMPEYLNIHTESILNAIKYSVKGSAIIVVFTTILIYVKLLIFIINNELSKKSE